MARTIPLASAPAAEPDSFPAMLQALEGGAFVRDATAALRATIRTLRENREVGGGRPAAKLSVTLDLQLIDDLNLVKADDPPKSPHTRRREGPSRTRGSEPSSCCPFVDLLLRRRDRRSMVRGECRCVPKT